MVNRSKQVLIGLISRSVVFLLSRDRLAVQHRERASTNCYDQGAGPAEIQHIWDAKMHATPHPQADISEYQVRVFFCRTWFQTSVGS